MISLKRPLILEIIADSAIYYPTTNLEDYQGQGLMIVSRNMDAQEFKAALKVLGLSKKAFAAWIGRTPFTVTRWTTDSTEKPLKIPTEVVLILRFMLAYPAWREWQFADDLAQVEAIKEVLEEMARTPPEALT